MASIISISDDIHICYMKNFQTYDTEDVVGEPHLILGFAYNIEGERMEDIKADSQHRFAECNPSSLRAFIREKEPLPLDIMVDPQDAEMARETIPFIVASLVRDCVGVEGLKTLQVDVIVEINEEEEECNWMGFDDAELFTIEVEFIEGD